MREVDRERWYDLSADERSKLGRNGLDEQPLQHQEYFDAVSRAASDKGRRFKREDILVEIVDFARENAGLPKSRAAVGAAEVVNNATASAGEE